jgi:hypothetical protein
VRHAGLLSGEILWQLWSGSVNAAEIRIAPGRKNAESVVYFGKFNPSLA